MAIDNLAQANAEIEKLWRRLERVERGAPVGFTAVSRGALRIVSAEGLIVEGSAKISGTLTGNGQMNWSGGITFTGPFSIDGVTTQTGAYTVNGPWTLAGAGTISGNVNMTGLFDLTGNANLSGTVTITGPTNISGTVTITGPLAVKGASTLEGNLAVTGAGVITAGLLEMGPNTGNGGAGITATSGDLRLITSGAGKVIATYLDVLLNLKAGELEVLESAYLRGSLSVTGATTVSGALRNPGRTTTTAAANVRMSETDHTFYLVSSARRFKIDPQPMALPDSLLAVPVKDWIDKGAHERGEVDVRVPGIIAEEVEEAGGSAFVEYDADGQVQSVSYDRLALARTEILARQLADALEQITELRAQLADPRIA